MFHALFTDVCFVWFFYFSFSFSLLSVGSGVLYQCSSSNPTTRQLLFRDSPAAPTVSTAARMLHGPSAEYPGILHVFTSWLSIPPESLPPDICDVGPEGVPEFADIILVFACLPNKLLLKSPAGVDCLPVLPLGCLGRSGYFLPIGRVSVPGFSFGHRVLSST